MPSQPVQSLDSELRVWKSPRHFRRLGGASESLSLDLGVSRYSPGAFLAPVSPGCFPISVWRGGESRPRSRPGLSPAGAWLRARLSGGGGLGCSGLAGRDPIDARAIRLLGFELEPELLAHHR